MNTTEKNYIYSANGKKKGEIINFLSRKCQDSGCNARCYTVCWENGKNSYPCSSMIKQISEHEYQICETLKQLEKKGFN